MDKPYFSILVPVYNVERYLATCIDSVLVQSFKDYELILVDDGSKDSSGKICDEYNERFPSAVKVIHKQNQGLISARRVGLKAACGRYVCFLDSDDFLDEDVLEKLKTAIEYSDADIIMYRWKYVDEAGKALPEISPSLFSPGVFEKEQLLQGMISSAKYNPLCLKCCRLELFDIDTDYSQYYEIQNAEDLLQSLPVIYNANSFFYLDEPLYNYRVNTSSLTHKFQNGKYKSLNVHRPLLYKYMEKMGLDTEENQATFYNTYLLITWQIIVEIYEGLNDKSSIHNILSEIVNYEFVRRAKKYLDSCDLLNYLKKTGMKLFYKQDTLLLDIYMKFYGVIIKCHGIFNK